MIVEGGVFVPRSSPIAVPSRALAPSARVASPHEPREIRSLVTELESVRDPRGLTGRRYRLSAQLAIAVCAMTSAGNDSLVLAGIRDLIRGALKLIGHVNIAAARHTHTDHSRVLALYGIT